MNQLQQNIQKCIHMHTHTHMGKKIGRKRQRNIVTQFTDEEQ